jgi:hypothetical protein
MAARVALATLAALAVALPCLRVLARRERRYVRLLIEPYRTDHGRAEALVATLDTLHKLLLRRWSRRLVSGQPSFALELHVEVDPAGAARASLAIAAPAGSERVVEAALRGAYPNTVVRPSAGPPLRARSLSRLKKRRSFIERIAVIGPDTLEDPPVDRLLTVMAAAGAGAAFVQLALTPAPAWFERFARYLHERRERTRASDPQRASQVAQVELLGGLDLQHRPLFFGDLRVGASDRRACGQIAAELRAGGGENRLVQRGAALRRRAYDRRVARGEGNPIPALRHGVYAANELAALWHFPSVGFARVPCARRAVPVAPASPAILRCSPGTGLLLDQIGPVTIHPELRRQNTAVVGAVEQGKTAFLLATVREDLGREKCALILLDPKGDAADAALSAVPEHRTATLLDLGRPSCGFNPLAVAAPADTIADFVVAALRQLFGDGDIRASSDRYLRNAIIAALACDREATLWDVARLLAPTDEGAEYRELVGAKLLGQPEYAEVAAFFAGELGAQLAAARATTTAKLDAPANKLARVLNSPSVKRVLLNRSLRIDLDGIVARGEVLVVKGALGEAGAGNVAVLMQLILGAIDATLARQQDRRSAGERVAVALKIDEAPLVINAAFAQTLALKRSAGLETVACWQTDSQWEPELREQLDALFAHRVYFATASAHDAREAAAAMMDEYSDQLRAGSDNAARLASPDVRLHLPRHHAIASWTTPDGRQQPFVGQTIPCEVDQARLEFHARRQRERGGVELADLAQPHWREPAAVEDLAGSPVLASEGGEPARPATTTGAPSFGELVALDAARGARVVPGPPSARGLYPDAIDLELLRWLAIVGWALTSQIHRRFNPERALTTTQRRLKRLAEGGALMRVQLHGNDGGGVPMCCAVSESGRKLLGEQRPPPPPALPADALDRAALSALRERVHVVGWLLALESRLGAGLVAVRGPRRLRLAPPDGVSGADAGWRAVAPRASSLPGHLGR